MNTQVCVLARLDRVLPLAAIAAKQPQPHIHRAAVRCASEVTQAPSAGCDQVISILQCGDINKLVRVIFTPGGKSNNKLYAPAGTTHDVLLGNDFFTEDFDIPAQDDRFRKRMAQRQQSDVNRVSEEQIRLNRLKGLDLAEALIGRHGGGDSGALSGNCYEMALVAAKLVHARFPDVKSYICSVRPPADHAFCLLAPAAIRETPDSIHDMCHAKLAQSTTWIVIDPWLNTACNAGTYQLNARDRLEKWTARLKRIAWSGADQNQPGWYPPTGSYSTALMTAPLKLKAIVK